MTPKTQKELVHRVRDECIQTALSAYENASISGLCGEGAFEAAISALRMMNVDDLVERHGSRDDPETSP